MFPRQCIFYYIFFAIFLDDFIIITQHFGQPLFFFRGGSSLLQKIILTTVIYFDLKTIPQKIQPPCVNRMENGHHFFFICRSAQVAATQVFSSKGHKSTILCEYCTYTNARSILFHHKGFVEVRQLGKE
jgi:hypothetical protein